jgi:uncharacterized protein
VRRVLFVSLGTLLVAVGFAGAFLPLVPTTFPLLLAAGLFARSSDRLHGWLLGHRVFGAYLRNYQEGLGMTLRHKVTTLVSLWVGIGVSAYFSRESVVAIIVLSVVLAGVTVHILTLPTAVRRTGPS